MQTVNDGGKVGLVERQRPERNDDCACPDTVSYLTLVGDPAQSVNDCACADAWPANQRPTAANQPFACAEGVLVLPLQDGYHALFSPLAPFGPSVLNDAALAAWRMFEQERPLASALDRFLADEGLVVANGAPLFQQAAPATLTAWLHVTNACNLDCPYCYVRKSSASMSLETGVEALERLFQEAEARHFQRIKLKYAGGESTLQMALVRDLHAVASHLASRSAVELSAVVLSNGTRIRPADADWLAAHNVKLMVSLDGAGASHDRLRSMRSGKPTFALIEKTIDEVLLPRGIRPDISITITQQNAGSIAEAVAWALARQLPVSLNFYRQTDQSRDATQLALEEEAIIAGLRSAYAVFEQMLPAEPFLNGLLDRVQFNAHTHTCGVGMAYVVISHEGKIAQCQMHLDQARLPAAGAMLLDMAAAGPVRNISVEQKHGCRQCPYRYRCSGGCPIETWRVTGRWDVASPHCNIYKTMLPEAIRLEGLRLLNMHRLAQAHPNRVAALPV